MRVFLAGPVALLLIACVDSNERTLRSTADGSQFTYNCGDVLPRDETIGKLRLVREYAGKILRYEMEEGSGAAVDAIRAPLISEDDAALERAVVAYMCDHDADHLQVARFPERGSPAPDLRLEAMLTGGSFNLQEHRGKVVVLKFWSSWCGPCRDEYPELIQIAQDYADSGLVLYIVLTRDTPEAAGRWFSEHNPLPTLLDRNGAAARTYRVRGIPHTYIIDRDGTVGTSWTGYVPGRLEDGLRQLSL